MDLVVISLIFLHTRLNYQFPFPLPGKRLNNPFGFLIIAAFLLGVVDRRWGDEWLNRLKKLATKSPQRLLFFGSLLSMVVFLEVMHFRHFDEPLWNLNVEQGNGTYFSATLLYLLGLIILIIYREEGKDPSKNENRWLWLLVAFVYLYLTLDECLAIHEQFMMWFQKIRPGAKAFHFIHEWLWVYVPFIVVVVVFFIRFFLWRFRNEFSVILILFIALSLWVSVIFFEGIAKNIVDPMGHGVLLIGMEEGAEMIGSLLFLIGFSRHLRKAG